MYVYYSVISAHMAINQESADIIQTIIFDVLIQNCLVLCWIVVTSYPCSVLPWPAHFSGLLSPRFSSSLGLRTPQPTPPSWVRASPSYSSSACRCSQVVCHMIASETRQNNKSIAVSDRWTGEKRMPLSSQFIMMQHNYSSNPSAAVS